MHVYNEHDSLRALRDEYRRACCFDDSRSIQTLEMRASRTREYPSKSRIFSAFSGEIAQIVRSSVCLEKIGTAIARHLSNPLECLQVPIGSLVNRRFVAVPPLEKTRGDCSPSSVFRRRLIGVKFHGIKNFNGYFEQRVRPRVPVWFLVIGLSIGCRRAAFWNRDYSSVDARVATTLARPELKETGPAR